MASADTDCPWPAEQVAEYRRLKKQCEECSTVSGFVLAVAGAVVCSRVVPYFRQGPTFRRYALLIGGAVVGQAVDLLHTSQACAGEYKAFNDFASSMDPRPPRSFK